MLEHESLEANLLELIAQQVEESLKNGSRLQRGDVNLVYDDGEWEVYRAAGSGVAVRTPLLRTKNLLDALVRLNSETLPY